MVDVENYKEFNEALPTMDSINTGTKMFFTLNSCPSRLITLYWKAIYGEKSTLVLVASNILKKSKDDFKKDALKIFAKIIQLFGFQNIFLHDDGKNIEIRENIYNVKGRTYFHI